MAYKYNPLTGQMDRVVKVGDGDVIAIEDVAGLSASLAGKEPVQDADQKVRIKTGTSETPDTTGWEAGTVYLLLDE